MAGIFTRKQLAEIMSNEALSPEERTEQVFSLYGRALDDGYVTKGAAKAAQESAIEQAKAEWEKAQPKPNAMESEEYKALQSQFEEYKAMQTARTSEDYKTIKPKFFETVYNMIDRKDGAKPVADQIAELRKGYEEYFTPEEPAGKPQFGAPPSGSLPKGEEGAVSAFANTWGYAPKKG